jgi:hypothetical protein
MVKTLAEPGVCGGCAGRENFAIRTGNVKQIMIKILIGLSASPTGESFFFVNVFEVEGEIIFDWHSNSCASPGA